jgi:hypothetical protein
MALVGSYGSGATINSTMECLLWGAIRDKPGPKDARADRRCDAQRRKVGIEVDPQRREDHRPKRRQAPAGKIATGVGTTLA